MLQIIVAPSPSRMTWHWVIYADGIEAANSLNGDGAYVGFEFRETALADACKVAAERFPVKAD